MADQQKRKATPQKRKAAHASSSPASKNGTPKASARKKNAVGFSPKKVIATIIGITAVVVMGLAIFDTVSTKDTIYKGVSVGDIDLSDKTPEEAKELIQAEYQPRIKDTTIYICADEETQSNIGQALSEPVNESLAEQQSVQSARENKRLWVLDSETAGVQIDADALAQKAFEVGRGEDRAQEQKQARDEGITIVPSLSYNTAVIEAIASEIDVAIGEPLENYSIAVDEGIAVVTEGHDGIMVDRTQFFDTLSNYFLDQEDVENSFVAQVTPTSVYISEEDAQEVCDHLNATLERTLTFSWNEVTWSPDRSQVGNWVRIETTSTITGGYKLNAYLDDSAPKGTVVKNLAHFNEDTLRVRFEMENDKPIVYPTTDELIPHVGEAIDQLNLALFDPSQEEPLETIEITDTDIIISVDTMDLPEKMTFEEALEHGIITSIAEYTTEYSEDALARNTNIHLVSDKLTNSIVKAEGGQWSFNDIAGDSTEEEGFLPAGAIYDGEYVDEIGGGICQVATTIYNAVYESGFPVVERSNHTLYIASYPAGRDAAVAYPYLDLVWENDSSSDVILLVTYTDYSVSAKIYGVDPEYQVDSIVGEWAKGEKYTTKKEKDDTLEAGTSYVKVEGTNGSSISVTRIVKDKNGEILRESRFDSVYDPKNEVIVEGPKKEKDTNKTTKDNVKDKESSSNADNEEG